MTAVTIGCFGLVPSLLFAAPANAADIAGPDAHPAASTSAAAPQRLVVRAAVTEPAVQRDGYTVTKAAVAVAQSASTNEDWARLVLIDGGWPVTQNNITAILQWMDSENPPEDWWNRNNPLNNGYGSGGGAGFGSYPSLAEAAEYAAANLHRYSGYSEIVSALAGSAPVAVTARAIMGSPWASGHYGYGSHWHDVDVPIIAAPPSAW